MDSTPGATREERGPTPGASPASLPAVTVALVSANLTVVCLIPHLTVVAVGVVTSSP